MFINSKDFRNVCYASVASLENCKSLSSRVLKISMLSTASSTRLIYWTANSELEMEDFKDLNKGLATAVLSIPVVAQHISEIQTNSSDFAENSIHLWLVETAPRAVSYSVDDFLSDRLDSKINREHYGSKMSNLASSLKTSMQTTVNSRTLALIRIRA